MAISPGGVALNPISNLFIPQYNILKCKVYMLPEVVYKLTNVSTLLSLSTEIILYSINLCSILNEIPVSLRLADLKL